MLHFEKLDFRGFYKFKNVQKWRFFYDSATGSGSFLIRAYDELLNYHADVHSKSAAQMDSFDCMPILTGNIFGVDLDQQAVEIARLNLLLRGLTSKGILKPLKDKVLFGNSVQSIVNYV
jgi:adenine-specific DNA-methyltransferase